MNEKHMQGRLTVKGSWLIPEDHADRMIGGSTNILHDMNEYAHTVAAVEGKYQNDSENARRLAACWNACEGLTQDEFDGGWTALGLSKYARRMEDRSSAARALLIEVLGDSDAGRAAVLIPLIARIRAFLAGHP